MKEASGQFKQVKHIRMYGEIARTCMLRSKTNDINIVLPFTTSDYKSFRTSFQNYTLLLECFHELSFTRLIVRNKETVVYTWQANTLYYRRPI